MGSQALAQSDMLARRWPQPELVRPPHTPSIRTRCDKNRGARTTVWVGLD
jgi:hypothetical protein